MSVSKRINGGHVGADRAASLSMQPRQFYSLEYLLADEDRVGAVKLYERALQGYEEIWGPEHAETLDTVNNLGLYVILEQHKEAEAMYKRALEGYTKVFAPESAFTYVPALNTIWARGLLSENLCWVDEARAWYSKALASYEAVFGTEYPKCQLLRDDVAALREAKMKSNACVTI
jgi:tetratricopeptide (TPR) repeat protein